MKEPDSNVIIKIEVGISTCFCPKAIIPMLMVLSIKNEANKAVVVRIASAKPEKRIMPWYVLKTKKKSELVMITRMRCVNNVPASTTLKSKLKRSRLAIMTDKAPMNVSKRKTIHFGAT